MTVPYKRAIAQWRKRKELIRRWKASGVSIAEIGRKLGVSRQRAHQLANGG